MKRTFTKLLLLALAVALCLALAACSEKEPEVKPTPEASESMLMVASYTNNAVVDGKLLCTEANQYALIPVGSELTAANAVIYTANSDFSRFVGIPAMYAITDGVITGAEDKASNLTGYSTAFSVKDGKYYFENDEIQFSDSITKSPAKYCVAFDGWSFYASDLTGAYGLDQYNDDTLTVYDFEGDGKYDFVVNSTVYNGLKIMKISGSTMVLNGGYGSSAWNEVFAEGSNNALAFKKTLSTKVPNEGTYVNVTIRVDATATTKFNDIPVMISSFETATTEIVPLVFAEYTDANNIISRINGERTHWSTSMSAQDGENGVTAGRGKVKDDGVGNVFNFVLDKAGCIVLALDADAKDIDASTTVGFTSFETANGTEAAALLDVQGLWHSNTTNYSTLQSRIALLYKMGIRRVYVVVSNTGFPQFSNTGCGYSSTTKFKSTVERFRAMGFEMPDHAIVKCCHDKGMECFAVYKIYEGGGMENIALGITNYDPEWTPITERLGQTVQLDSFLYESLVAGNDYRVCRRPDGANDNLEGTITKITVDYVTSSYTYRNNNQRRGEYNTHSAIDESVIKTIADGVHTFSQPHSLYNVNVWTSDTNGQYDRYTTDFTYQFVRGSKILYNANGDPMYDGQRKNVVTLEITGLNINTQFVAVSLSNTTGLCTCPLSFIHIYSGDREITCTSTEMVRYADDQHDENPEEYIWSHDKTPCRCSYAVGIEVDENGVCTAIPDGRTFTDEAKQAEYDGRIACLSRFNLYGFSFNFEPYCDMTYEKICVIGVARGKEDTFPGGWCEAYPEVRQHWLEHVETILEANYDGVCIRIQSHSSIASDFKNYGYNEPIVEKYKELYGQAAYDLLMDPNHHVTDDEYIKLCRIRGDFCYMFLEEASALCHEYGVPFCCLLRESYVDPIVSSAQNEFTWWTMPKIILPWEKVVDLNDFVVIKDYIQKEIYIVTSTMSATYGTGSKIRDYAKKQGKEVWIECYDDQAQMFTKNFFSYADKAKTSDGTKAIDGIILYELSGIQTYYENGLGQSLAGWGFKEVVGDKNGILK